MYFFFLYSDRQKQEVVTQTAEVGHRRKRPCPPTSHNNKPIPTPQRLRQQCRPLPWMKKKKSAPFSIRGIKSS